MFRSGYFLAASCKARNVLHNNKCHVLAVLSVPGRRGIGRHSKRSRSFIAARGSFVTAQPQGPINQAAFDLQALQVCHDRPLPRQSPRKTIGVKRPGNTGTNSVPRAVEHEVLSLSI